MPPIQQHMPTPQPVDWKARWISTDPATYPASCLPLFRKSLSLSQTPTRALAHICGLGHFELRVNGAKAGDDVLEPGWTHYRKRCLYVTHDLTPLLRQGDNSLGVLLGNGIYNVTGARYKKFKASFGPPKLICQLHVQYPDGTTAAFLSDLTWRCYPGPITFSCIYGGEDYDARVEPAGWDQPRFDDSRWPAVAVVDPPGGKLMPQTHPPTRIMRTFQTRSVTRPAPATRIHDLGQNFSGWPALTTRGPAGARITLTTGELLDPATGLVNQRNTGKPVNFSYTLAGAGSDESWHPRFSLTGFRYVQVDCPDHPDLPVNVTGHFVHASAPVAGEFRCSNDLFNRIHELILAAIRSNLHSVITDCPHREKLGWLEQVHLMGPAIIYNLEVGALYRKIADDIRDAQQPDGNVPTIAPEYVTFTGKWADFSNSPEWGSAAVLVPWLLYQRYGDRNALAAHYDVMQRYVDYLDSRLNPDGTISFGLGDWYDIGPGDPGFSKLTSKTLTATAIYYLDVDTLRRAAQVLGKPDDAARYRAQADRIRSAFNASLFDPATGRYDRGSQTAQAMPLALGLVDPAHRDAVLAHLVDDIRAHDNHITAGDIGFRFVLAALSEASRSDVIYDLLTQTDPPSYASQLARGATTLTEAWDAHPGKSQNHLMLGHAEIWFYESLAGLHVDLSRPPDQQILISPQIVGDLTWASATHHSVLGAISTRWERRGDRVDLHVAVPDNASATVHLGDLRAVIGPGAHRLSASLP